MIDLPVLCAADGKEQAEEGPSTSQAHILLLCVLLASSALAAAVVATSVYPAGSGNLDEVAYASQANALEHGRLTLDASDYGSAFRPYLSGVHEGRFVFKYQPVWPGLMALSDQLVGSTLPLLIAFAAGGVVGMYAFVNELLRSRRAAIIAGLLMACSPFVWLQSGTVLAYHPTLVFVSFAGATLLHAARTSSRLTSLVAGMIGAVSLFHRPFDAVLLLGPITLYAEWNASSRSRLAGRRFRCVPGASSARIKPRRATGADAEVLAFPVRSRRLLAWGRGVGRVQARTTSDYVLCWWAVGRCRPCSRRACSQPRRVCERGYPARGFR